MNSLQSGADRILVRRAEGAQLLRRGPRAIALSETGGWLELAAAEQRLWVDLERSQTMQALERKGPAARALVERLYEARLATVNGRLRPLRQGGGGPPETLAEVSLDDLDKADGMVLVQVPPNLDDETFRRLVDAMRRGLVVVPRVLARRPEDFCEAFFGLARRGFRLFRVEPSKAGSDEEATAQADGMLAMAEEGAQYARQAPARFRVSGLDAWLRRLCGEEVEFVSPHPRCERCLVHGLCRPQRAWTGMPGTTACAFARRTLEGLVWMVADQPDLRRLLAGGS